MQPASERRRGGAPGSEPTGRDRRRQLLRPIPRRAPIAAQAEAGSAPARMGLNLTGQLELRRALRSFVRWTVAAFRYGTAQTLDRLRGVASAERTAVRRRAALQRMGGTAVKVGIQLAGRIDLLTPESADELAALVDRVPPIELDYALERLEHAVGQPLDEVFGVIDPIPIQSTTMMTTYQALLTDGDKVVVKIRRPDAAPAFAADLWSLQVLLRSLELLTLVRPGFFSSLRDELQGMLLYELDFVQIARYHRLFNRETRRARVSRRYRAARVYADYSNDEVMVSEFVSGYWLAEIISAVQRDDKQLLAELSGAGIDARVISRRTLQMGWWSLFETYLFFAEPLPSNIVVEAGNKMVLVSLSDCGHGTLQNRELQERVFLRLARDDVSGAVEGFLHWLAPLPLIDVIDFRKKLEARLWAALFGLRDPEAPPHARTSRHVWRSLSHTAAEFGVPVRLEVAKRMRASLLYDDLAAELDPELQLLKEFDRYQRGATRRRVRRFARDVRKTIGRNEHQAATATAIRVGEMAERAGFLFRILSRQLPPEFQPMTLKSAYVAAVVLRALAGAGAVLSVASLGLVLRWWWIGHPISGGELLTTLAQHPLSWVVALVFVVMTIRRIGFRLDDKDYD